MTEKTAIRIAEALERIALNLSEDGPIAMELTQLLELLEEALPKTGVPGRRHLRTFDIGQR